MIGKIISHYEIIEKLGAGGMGEVYLAEDTELDRKIAIKFLSPHYTTDEKINARFKREAKAAASLNHPNIITIHEVSEYEGKTYIVMESVEGESLKDFIAKRRLSINETIEIVLQICEGLNKAHEAEVVHRDLKPGNILINKDGRVKIIDFGLAKLKGVTKLTKDSVTIGTLHFMSPEQAQGVEVDQRTDIWSLGVILYEMITGNLPFQGEYEAAVLYSILNEEPKLLASHKVDVSEELQQIVSNVLKKNPDERYQNVSDITSDLQNYQQAITPDLLRPRPVVKKLKKREKLSWIKKVLLGFGLLLPLSFGIVAWYIYPFLYVPEPIKQQHDKAIAVLYFDNMSAEEDAYFTDGLTEELISRLTRVKNLKVASRTDDRIYKSKPATIAEIGKDLNVDYIVEGSVRKAENRIRISAQLINVSDGFHRWTETYDRVISDIFAVQDDVAINIAQRLDMEISNRDRSAIALKPTESIEAYDLVLKAKSQGIESLSPLTPADKFEEIHSMLERAVELDPKYVDAWSSLGTSYLIQIFLRNFRDDIQEWKPRLEKAISATQQALAIDPQNELAATISPLTLLIKAVVQDELKEGGFKLLLYRRAKVQTNKLARLYPESPVANLVLGMCYRMLYENKLLFYKRNSLKKVIAYFEKSIESSKQILKTMPNDPIALYSARASYEYLFQIYHEEDRYEEALHYLEEQNEINKRTGNIQYEMSTIFNMARTLRNKGEYDKAINYYERAFDIAYELSDSTSGFVSHKISKIFKILLWCYCTFVQYRFLALDNNL